MALSTAVEAVLITLATTIEELLTLLSCRIEEEAEHGCLTRTRILGQCTDV
jgi:hypothetical protein